MNVIAEAICDISDCETCRDKHDFIVSRVVETLRVIDAPAVVNVGRMIAMLLDAGRMSYLDGEMPEWGVTLGRYELGNFLGCRLYLDETTGGTLGSKARRLRTTRDLSLAQEEARSWTTVVHLDDGLPMDRVEIDSTLGRAVLDFVNME